MSTRSLIAMVLAYLVPGAGHLYLGLRARAAAFFTVILVLFTIGVSLGGLYTLAQAGGQLLRVLASLGSMGAGLLYFIGQMVGPEGDVRSITYEYGRTFALTAGLMNLLLVLDVYDIGEGRKE